MEVLFIPFGSRENNRQLITMASQWQAAYQRQAWATQCENQIYTPGGRGLESVNSADTLYILAHGQGTQLIINVPNGNGFVLDARMLALRVFESGLPRRHGRIVLSICNNDGSLEAFAQAFKEEMWQLNYSGALQVFYFAGSVSIPRVLDQATGEIGQSVLFMHPTATIVSTPSGLAQTGRMLKASHFMYQA